MAGSEDLTCEVQRLAALANELTLRCVLEGVDVSDICLAPGGEPAWQAAAHGLMPWTDARRIPACRLTGAPPAANAQSAGQGATPRERIRPGGT